MKDKLESYCKVCDSCQSRKPSKLTKAPLEQDPVSEPMEKVSRCPWIFTCDSSFKSVNSSDHRLLHKMEKAVALPDQEAATITLQKM